MESSFSKLITTDTEVVSETKQIIDTLDWEACHLFGIGRLQRATLKDVDGGTVSVDGSVSLLSLQGHVWRDDRAIETLLMCTLASPGANGAIMGGELLEGMADFVTLTFVSLTTTPHVNHHAYRRTAVKASGRGEGRMQQWTNAMKVSRNGTPNTEVAAVASDTEDQGPPRAGDIVRHPRFGDCRVARLDDSHIVIQNPEGRVLQLGLRILHFSLLGTDGKHSVWTVDIHK